MTFRLGLLLALAVMSAPGPGAAERPRFEPRFELLVLDDEPRLTSETERSLAVVRSAASRRPRFAARAEDVETYVWKTQRITLTREASARLAAALAAANPERRSGAPARDGRARDLWYRIFQVRLNGEFLYGGIFTDPDFEMHRPYPVCHAEWVDGHAIFYLLPMQMDPGRLGEYEETLGASRYFVRYAHRPALPADFREDPTVLRFRAVLRDARVQALFAGLGKLVREPPPPVTPEEIRSALVQTDAEVHRRFAGGDASIEPLLQESYVLYHTRQRSDECRTEPRGPVCESEGKQSVLASMKAGRWNLAFYAVPAIEPPELTGERSATIRSLIVMRGDPGSSHVLGQLRSPPWDLFEPLDRVVVSTRRYEFDPPAWQLKDETHERCDGLLAGGGVLQDDLAPCWPPRKPTRSSGTGSGTGPTP